MSYQGFVFDLDGTLYDENGMDEANKIALVSAVSEWLGVSNGDAQHAIDQSIGEYEKSSGRPSLYGATLKLGVPDEVIGKWQDVFIVPNRILSRDEELSDLLNQLSKVAKLCLMTNTRTKIACNALHVLGINPEVFVRVFGGETLEHPKPSPRDLVKLATAMGVPLNKCVSVGDRWSTDLEPAKSLGMATYLVNNREDLVRWLTKLLNGEAHTS